MFQHKKLSESILPELIKRLILCSCPDLSNIRIPGKDDVWAPGFDGIVINQQRFRYVNSGQSVWEFGTNADSLSKINSDYKKRMGAPLGIDRRNTTFYLVIPKIWAYQTSISQWENEHKADWKDVHVYDASVLCDWINYEPAVCAWFFETYYQQGHLEFSSVTSAWAKLAHKTTPAFSHTMFIEGRKNQANQFHNMLDQQICRVKADTSVDAYGFSLSLLLQDSSKANTVIVVYDENTYRCLSRNINGKTFLLHFPFTGQINENNRVIQCFNREVGVVPNVITLEPLRKSQFIHALCEMNMTDIEAQKLYADTHGSLLSMIRKIPGTSANFTLQWAAVENIDLLCPLIFLRHYSVSSPEEQELVARLAGIEYAGVELKYEELYRMEDSPIKKVDNQYILVNYEEAWMTLHVDISNNFSKRLYDEIISTLSQVCETKRNMGRLQSMLYNYIYFAKTGSDQTIIHEQIRKILKYIYSPWCFDFLLDELPILAEAAPQIVLELIESELEDGIVAQVFYTAQQNQQYCKVLLALDKLVMEQDTSIRACRVLYKLCEVDRKCVISNSPKDSLLNALCLWDYHAALDLAEKEKLTEQFMKSNPDIGVPLAIELISKRSIFIAVNVGQKEREPKEIYVSDLLAAHNQIASLVFEIANSRNRIDWIEMLLQQYQLFSCEILSAAAEKFDAAAYSAEELVQINYQVRNLIFSLQKYHQEQGPDWLESLRKWLYYAKSDDPIVNVGWMFYKYYPVLFEEVLLFPITDYEAEERRGEEVRKEKILSLTQDIGIDDTVKLIRYMEDDLFWGYFLGKNFNGHEYAVFAQEICRQQKWKILSGLLDAGNLSSAANVFNSFSEHEKEVILPLLIRTDIMEWLTSSKYEQLYWGSKNMREYNDQAYHNLLKYNPCGLLRYLYYELKNSSEIPDKTFEIFSAVTKSKNIHDKDLLRKIIQIVDKRSYCDEWAELCLSLYDMGLLQIFHGYYPQCLEKYFFRHPAKMLEMYKVDNQKFFKHFYSRYHLPPVAYESYLAFTAWTDTLYDSDMRNFLANILGRSPNGADGIFPHEFVRRVLEKYSDRILTTDVGIGKINSLGVRIVDDGTNEQKMADQYRADARHIEIEYPQTASILQQIADFYESDAKRDRMWAEIERVF